MLYVILGMIVPVIALLVAFVRSRNVPTGDAMLRESVKYMLIGLIVDAVAGVLLLMLGMGLAVSFVSML